ncbi:hypothetical protein MLD38_025584 [Melastoma candidum]|uniref:Uncharacterized protein n=1 Tax=Melastoma candidum TaxID=119954 RepID=A0ACB9NWA2_9MYRT|nr:hypothetical protein MLD38_025584 [Melastoma candidum]
MFKSTSFSDILPIVVLGCCFVQHCPGDSENIQDICPTFHASDGETVFINGLPCKPPYEVTPSDFKSMKLSDPGDTDNFRGSAVSILTAAEYPGLNTLGLSVARTDLTVDGLVMPHSHPRASEIMYVYQGKVVAGFVDTRNQLFQKSLGKGDVMVFPRGLLHFSLNVGYDDATIFSVLNSQNPGVVGISDAMFMPRQGNGSAMASRLRKRVMRFISKFNDSSMTQ